MMRYSILVIGVILLNGCGTVPKESNVPVSYEMTSYRLDSPGCPSESKPCAYYEITYPKFTALNPDVEAKLNREIELSFSMGDPEAEDKTLQQVAEDFLKEHENYTRDDTPELGANWNYIGKTEVNLLTDTLISLRLYMQYYSGGAHGGRESYFINIHPKTGVFFTLENFFKPGYIDELTRVGEKAFRKERNLSETESFSELLIEFPDDKFQLNQNYGFTSEGIIFYYNNYEIAPYAVGPTEILVPYGDMKSWIRNR